MPQSIALWDLGLAFGVSFLICGFLILSRSWHLKLTMRRDDGRAVQAAHSQPTPRVGGVGIVAACIVSLIGLGVERTDAVTPLFVLSLMPVFLAGLLEDLGFRVRPRERLFAAALSSAVAVAVLQMWVPRADVPGIDWLLNFTPLAVTFTLFATSGICNAFNLIDGLNGLASATAIIVASCLAAVAFQAGDISLAETAMVLSAAFAGFLVLNFPLGKIFLGDAGAYTIGHLLSWLAVIIMVRVPDVTPWAIILIFFWPVADTLLAIYRRRVGGRPAGAPDRLHFHQLVMRGLEITLLGRRRRQLANPLATLIILPLAIMPALAGVALWDKPFAAFLALSASAAAFSLTYALALRVSCRRGRNLLAAFGSYEPSYSSGHRA
ncbi:MraY family glycosyltransferase [Paracoccus tibetensis]|uniref:UDP-N-acetylmuramyl pentapeptide phosphotransferase/UDP-N-acetylglucosamine-1-phosphate transferase n=1 Tax=Paracoccus tibetensis TaxID=336292 RepID=A0A1G5DP58_9RHOB|nr:glycosyltransferase [Paracoccus tibetensis]SCY16494.1 UDP-N-acetylmuramyl pentapeptide phosphotransferase/UDP-N-acetylglucosamine-1-phosphate transferase [Paracoccus tibetensis]